MTLTVPSLKNVKQRTQSLFFLNGLLYGTWAVLIPAVQARFALSPSALAAMLFVIMVGNLVALPLVTRLMKRIGPAATTAASFIALGGSLMFLPFCTSHFGLGACLLVYGVAFGAVDYALNAVGGWVQDQLGPIMSSLHGSFSVGTLMAGGVGSLLLRMSTGLPLHLVGASVLTMVLGALIAGALPERLSGTADEAGVAQESGAPSSGLSRLLLLVLVVGFAAALCEGTVNDWAAVSTQQLHHVSASTASLGFTAFALLMVVGRFSGDWLTARFGPGRLAALASLLCTVGLGLVTLAALPAQALAGFALTGLGLSVLAPLAFSAAWNYGETRGIALMTGVFYAGFLCGPPLAGAVVHAAGFQAVFLLPLALTLLSLLLSFTGVFRAPAAAPAAEVA